MVSPICCDNPQVIINKNAISIVRYFRYYYFRGRLIHGVNIPPRNRVDINDVDSSYVYNRFGEKIPLYYVVPCGKCALCQDRNKRFLAFRFEAETAKYDSHKPLFATFTYKRHLRPKGIRYKTKVITWYTYEPVIVDNVEEIQVVLHSMEIKIPIYVQVGLSSRDMTNFFKKFRMMLYVNGLPTDFRYYYCGEYGTDPTKDHAPHYHVIFWNLPDPDYFCDDMTKTQWLVKLNRMMRKCWRRGYRSVQLGIVDLEIAGESRKRVNKNSGSSSGAARYVGKYVGKKYCPVGAVKPFVHCSCKDGGIGMSYIRDNVEHYRKVVQDNRCEVTNPWTLETYSTTLCPQYIQYAFPTLSKIVPKEVRLAFEAFQCFYNTKLYIEQKFINKPDYHRYDYIYDKYRYLPLSNDNLYTPNIFKAEYSARLWSFAPYPFDSRDDNYYDVLQYLTTCIDMTLLILEDFKLSSEIVENMLRWKKKRTAYIDTLPKRTYDTNILEFALQRHQDKLDREAYF